MVLAFIRVRIAISSYCRITILDLLNLEHLEKKATYSRSESVPAWSNTVIFQGSSLEADLNCFLERQKLIVMICYSGRRLRNSKPVVLIEGQQTTIIDPISLIPPKRNLLKTLSCMARRDGNKWDEAIIRDQNP